MAGRRTPRRDGSGGCASAGVPGVPGVSPSPLTRVRATTCPPSCHAHARVGGVREPPNPPEPPVRRMRAPGGRGHDPPAQLAQQHADVAAREVSAEACRIRAPRWPARPDPRALAVENTRLPAQRQVGACLFDGAGHGRPPCMRSRRASRSASTWHSAQTISGSAQAQSSRAGPSQSACPHGTEGTVHSATSSGGMGPPQSSQRVTAAPLRNARAQAGRTSTRRLCRPAASVAAAQALRGEGPRQQRPAVAGGGPRYRDGAQPGARRAAGERAHVACSTRTGGPWAPLYAGRAGQQAPEVASVCQPRPGPAAAFRAGSRRFLPLRLGERPYSEPRSLARSRARTMFRPVDGSARGLCFCSPRALRA